MIYQKNIINGYKKINELNNIKLPAAISLKLYRFKNKLKEYYDWQSEEEKKIFEEYGAKFEDGKITLEEENKIQEFAERLNSMGSIEVDIDKMEIPVEVFGEISVEDLEILDGIFEFIE